jgi:hypothetical protein
MYMVFGTEKYHTTIIVITIFLKKEILEKNTVYGQSG